VRLGGRLDRAALAATFNDIVARHETLRTRFASRDGVPVQLIEPALQLPLEVVDLCDLPHGEREARAHWLAQDEMQLPFDLERDCLIRVRLFALDEAEHILTITMHHISMLPLFKSWLPSTLSRM